MKKPLVGILTNIITVEEGPYAGGERIYVNRDYIRCVIEAGGIPFLLPIVSDIGVIHQQIEWIDALLLSGGQDVSPHHYNEEAKPWLGKVSQERDSFELAAVKHAIKLKKPLFGVCRGAQLLNVALGGSLFQDIEKEHDTDLKHLQAEHRVEATHPVEIVLHSRLHKIFGQEVVCTNSFHHQSVKELGADLIVSAISSDGVVEAIESTGDHFILGVQWHPEMMVGNPLMGKLFSAFIDEAGS